MATFNLDNKASKIAVWLVGAIVLMALCVIGYLLDKNSLHSEFKETRIYPDDNRVVPGDTVFMVKGIPFRMIGVNGGGIDCEGLSKTIELDDFYIGETAVTQQLWSAVMNDKPIVAHIGDSLPVTSVDLMECLDFVNALDSISGLHFTIPTYPQWLYAAHLDKIPSKGNIAEWTISRADPLFIVAGASSEDEGTALEIDSHKFVQPSIKSEAIGFRLVYMPSGQSI